MEGREWAVAACNEARVKGIPTGVCSRCNTEIPLPRAHFDENGVCHCCRVDDAREAWWKSIDTPEHREACRKIGKEIRRLFNAST